MMYHCILGQPKPPNFHINTVHSKQLMVQPSQVFFQPVSWDLFRGTCRSCLCNDSFCTANRHINVILCFTDIKVPACHYSANSEETIRHSFKQKRLRTTLNLYVQQCNTWTWSHSTIMSEKWWSSALMYYHASTK